MKIQQRTCRSVLGLILAMALAMTAALTPGVAFADEATGYADYTYTQASGTAATIEFDSPVTAVASSQPAIATAEYSGTTVSVTGVGGAVGVATITVTTGKGSYDIAVPVGYTTFVFNGEAVTVYEGADTKYDVTTFDETEDELDPTATQNADGSTTYTSADATHTLSVEIKKSGGSYVFAGTASDASISVKKDADSDAHLLLAGVSVTSSFTAPITVKKKEDADAIVADAQVYITALEGHRNSLTDAARNNDDIFGTDAGGTNALAESAVIKGKAYADITVDGHGELDITAQAKNGIKVAEYGSLTVRDVTLVVTSTGHGISSDNTATFWSGDISITTTGGDGIRSDPDAVSVESGAAGTLTFYDAAVTVDTSNDGIQAAQDLTIYGGEFNITTFGGYENNRTLGDNSAKGLKASASSTTDDTDTSEATNNLTIYNGVFTLNCADDAIHSDNAITVTGGQFAIWTGDDAMHADTTLTLGTQNGENCALQVKVNACYEGLEAGTVVVNSGSYDIASSDDGVNAAGGAGGDTTGFNPGGWNWGRGGMMPGGWGPGGNTGFNPGGTPGSASSDYSITINGGLVKIVAGSSGDGIDSNGDLTITGGTIVVWGGTGAENPLDYDGTFTVTDGTLFAAGRNDMRVGSPASGSQSYQSATTSLTAGRTVTVTVNGETVVSQTVPANGATYEFYSQSDAFSTMTVTQSDAAAQNIPALWSDHNDSDNDGVCDTCGLTINGASDTADALGTHGVAIASVAHAGHDDIVTTAGSDSGDDDGDDDVTPYTATFVADGGVASIDVYYTQDYTTASETDVSTAVARNSDTGEVDTSGDGQVNFKVNLADGYEVESVTADTNYKNIKEQDDNIYRVTKVTGDLTITVTTKKAGSDSGDDTGKATSGDYYATFAPDTTYSVYVFYTQDKMTAYGEGTVSQPDQLISADSTVTAAYARDADSGEIATESGNGQVNFVIVPADGYTVSEVEADANYKNLKDSDDTGVANGYRLTKVSGAVTVTVSTVATSGEKPSTEPTSTSTPTESASTEPTATPSEEPSVTPTPTAEPTVTPTATSEPTTEPTDGPTWPVLPTNRPTWPVEPTDRPTWPVIIPTVEPSESPTTQPTTTASPSVTPSEEPSPSVSESVTPSAEPSASPDVTPTPATEPTGKPEPTVEPSESPTPTNTPAVEPTATSEPTVTPTPTVEPSVEPTAEPEPTVEPTATPEPTQEPTVTPVNVYRLYNPNTGEHLFTTDAAEYAALQPLGWRGEGIAWTAPASGTGVHRLYNGVIEGGDHHYTADAAEIATLVAEGWSDEGIVFYSAEATASGAVPIYRVYNPNAVSCNHHFTADETEYRRLVNIGWDDESADGRVPAFYAVE